jgi:hypothetical protein
MHPSRIRAQPTRPAAALCVAAACLALSACGSTANPRASASSVSAAAPPASTATRPAGTTGRTVKPASTKPTGAHHAASDHTAAQLKRAFSSYTACLSRHGVNLHPAQPTKRTTLSATGAGTNTPPSKKALTACAPALPAALRQAAKSLSLTAPAARTRRQPIPAPTTAALERFTTCMHNNGITTFPPPEHGGGYNLIRAHINQANPRYKTAQAHCYPILQEAVTPRP